MNKEGKMLFNALIVFLIFISLFAVSVLVSKPVSKPAHGDYNLDGKVDANDISSLVNVIK